MSRFVTPADDREVGEQVWYLALLFFSALGLVLIIAVLFEPSRLIHFFQALARLQ